MTIAGAFLTAEGVVFGVDSTITVSEAGNTWFLDHGQKLFEIGEPGRGRFALCWWGQWSVGDVTHRTIVARLADRLGAESTLEGAVDELVRLIDAERERQGSARIGNFGYFIGGTEPRTHNPGCVELNFEKGGLAEKIQFQMGEIRFQGRPEIFARIHSGYDPALPVRFASELTSRLGNGPLLTQANQAFEAAAASVNWGKIPALPLREAIDFLHTYLSFTAKAFKFRSGAPICGGPLEIAFISTDRPFRWVRHKPFDIAIDGTDGGLPRELDAHDEHPASATVGKR